MEQRKPKNKYPNENRYKHEKLVENVTIDNAPDVPAVDPKYAKRQIASNKEKYEKEIVNEENDQMLAADFAKLLENPQSIGGHFQFSTEKQWFSGDNESEITNKLFQEYFNLNLSLLNESILTVPFYKRLNLNEDLFNEREIDEMNRKAAIMQDKYRKNVDANRDNMKKFTGEVEKISNNILELLKPPEGFIEIQDDKIERTVEVEKPVAIVQEKPKDVDAKPQRSKPNISKPVEKTASSQPKSQQIVVEEHEDDLDEILKNPNKLSHGEAIQIKKPSLAVETIDVTCELKSPIKETVKQDEKEEEDIQKWLDDVLNV